MRIGCIAAGLAALAVIGAAPARADDASLYQGPAPRPGPDILYAPPADAPQLHNSGPWRAQPILVSGAGSYRDGEFVYQDFLYDDHGANAGQRDPGDPRAGDDSFSQPNGTYTYPTDPVYAQNAADLVELRVRPQADATVFRLTLNTMLDADRVAATIAIGTSAAPMPFPHGANATAPAELFLTVHGNRADLVNALGVARTPAPQVTVLKESRQIEISVPHGAWDPGRATVRLAAGVGLWDRAASRYLVPGNAATATTPGGAGALPAPPAFFNVAFRFDEPQPTVSDPSGTVGNPAWWRDKQQGQSLRTGDLSPFHADVDFGKLLAGTNDDSRVPSSGSIDRILASHFETKQGVDFNASCGSSSACLGELRGRLVPYALYIPHKTPARYGFTPLMHSLGANYNQYSASRNQSQFGERGQGHLIATPSGRGPDGWYYDHAGAEVFEVWADVARHYPLDPDLTSVAGYSMGGYGTYKLATEFPDLFAKGQPTVGPPGQGVWVPPADPQPGGAQSNTFRQLASLRNIPFLIWNAASDELVPYAGPKAQAGEFDRLDYRYEFDTFAPAEHLTLAVHDQYQPAADYLADARVDRDPAHVTYVRNPTMDFPSVGTTADHAYWLSGIALRAGGGAAPLGTVDARSEAFGTGDPKPGATQNGAGSLSGGNLGSIGYTSQSKGWGAAPVTSRADVLDLTARNVSAVTVHPARAKLTCAGALRVNTDGPVTVTLAGCGRTETFQATGAAVACASRAGFRSASARPRGRRLRVRFTRRSSKPVRVDVFRNSNGRRVLGNRRVARFTKRTRSFTWKARRAGRGIYTVRLRSGSDVREVVLSRRGGRFHRRPASSRRRCGTLRSFALGLPVFGGTRGKRLAVSYRLGSARTARVTVLRGTHVVKRFKARSRRAGRTYRLKLVPRKLKRATYRVRLTLTRRGTKPRRVTLAARRL
ncbi:MAG: glucodextranase DOMON-like domain-containing protein [Solirubrobacteraceae bacterium]